MGLPNLFERFLGPSSLRLESRIATLGVTLIATCHSRVANPETLRNNATVAPRVAIREAIAICHPETLPNDGCDQGGDQGGDYDFPPGHPKL